MQLCCKRKIYKEKYRMFARDSQMLRNKRHFIINVIAINMFYCIYKIIAGKINTRVRKMITNELI